MNLRDIMSEAGLAGYAQIGLVISFVAFVAVVVWVLLRPREEMEAGARQALEGDEPDHHESEHPSNTEGQERNPSP